MIRVRSYRNRLESRGLHVGVDERGMGARCRLLGERLVQVDRVSGEGPAVELEAPCLGSDDAQGDKSGVEMHFDRKGDQGNQRLWSKACSGK